MSRLVDVLNKDCGLVCKVGPTVTSVGASRKAGFPVHMSLRFGRMVWIQNGDPFPQEKVEWNRPTFGQPGYRG